MNVWAFANQKGGVGKTTSAVTLAGILAARKEETLIIDLDPHASMSSYFGIEPESVSRGVFELFTDQTKTKNVKLSSVVHQTDIEHPWVWFSHKYSKIQKRNTSMYSLIALPYWGCLC